MPLIYEESLTNHRKESHENWSSRVRRCCESARCRLFETWSSRNLTRHSVLLYFDNKAGDMHFKLLGYCGRIVRNTGR